MSQGRLAPVRETDRHAALVAGLAAAACSAGTFAGLYALNVRPALGNGSDSFATTFPFYVGVAAAIGLAVGAAQGAVAARQARRAADRFAPLPAFARKVFVWSAVANVIVAAIATGVAFTGSDLVIAELASFIVAIGASAIGASIFAWSHAIDWPHVPDYLFENVPARPQQRQRQRRVANAAPTATQEPVVDIDAGAGIEEVVNEGRSRRSAIKPRNIDDEIHQEIQDLIRGR